MVKKSRTIGVFLGIIFSLVLVCAAHVITTSDGGSSYNLDEETSFLFNITVDNTDSVAEANISEVSITIPSSFSFTSDSNGTSASASSFSSASSVLTWTNDGIVMNLASENFWFDATASIPGEYNITVVTTNSSGIESTNIGVTVNDTTVPSVVEFVTPSEDGENIDETYLDYNVAVTDEGTVDTILVWLYNSTLDEINSSSSSGSASSSGTFTGLSEGVYYINATANDSEGYSNSSATWTIIIDLTDPTVSLGAPNDDVSSTTSAYNFTFTPSDARGIDRCRLIYDGDVEGTLNSVVNATLNGIYASSLSSGTNDWKIKCEDYAGNIGYSVIRQLTVVSQAAIDGTIGTTTNYWTNTFAITDSQFEDGYNKLLDETERVRVVINSSNHYVGIIDVTSTSVVINVSSDPQQNTLSIGDEWKVDVTDNDRYDLMVTLEGIVSYEANITVIEINEAVSVSGTTTTGTSDEATGLTDVEGGEEGSYTWLIVVFIVVALVAAGVAGYLYYKKRRKMMGFE